jgi:hypothetical protein
MSMICIHPYAAQTIRPFYLATLASENGKLGNIFQVHTPSVDRIYALASEDPILRSRKFTDYSGLPRIAEILSTQARTQKPLDNSPFINSSFGMKKNTCRDGSLSVKIVFITQRNLPDINSATPHHSFINPMYPEIK